MFKIMSSALLAASLALPALAHGGGLNSEGCHNNRKTGDYHCHRPKAKTPTTRPKTDTAQRNSLRADNRSTTRTTAFRNCDAARAAGAAPVYRGQAGYGRHLDRDNDGIGCE